MTEVVDQVGRTRWKRFGVVMVPAVAAAGALAIMVANGALAVSFAVSGSEFKVSADELVGQGFEQYGSIDHDVDGDLHPVVVTVIGDAELTNLCQTVKIEPPIPIPGVDHIIVRIEAGDAGDPVEASNLVVDAIQLGGNATFSNIQIGRDASTLDAVPGANGAPGQFGQQATGITITELEQTALATTAGTFTLPSLSLGLDINGDECF